MRICWDTLQGIKLTINGIFLKNHNSSYIYKDKCKNCGEPYLTLKGSPSLFCSRSCNISGKYHHFYGKKLSIAHKNKLSKAFSGDKNPFYGKKHSEKSKNTLSEKATGRKFSKESKRKMSLTRKNKPIHSEKYKRKLSKKFKGSGNPMYGLTDVLSPNFGKKSYNWKGGVTKLELVLYQTYGNRLKNDGIIVRPYDLLICNRVYKIVEAKCYYCNKWYVPNKSSVRRRIQKIEGSIINSKCNLYCSKKCKCACPEYRKIHSIKVSKFETEVYNFVNSIFEGVIIRNDRTQIFNPITGYYLELDLWFPTIKKAIECNGVYWHSKKSRKNYDRIKKNVCEKLNIQLLIITDKEWKQNISFFKNKIKNFI